MSAKKSRKRAYIPPNSEVVNRRERTTTTSTRSPARSSRGGGGGGRGNARAEARANYEYPTPSLQRTAKRLPIYFVLIFALQFYLLGTGKDALQGGDRLQYAAIQSGVVTLVFAPFMHMMDRLAYSRYLKRSGRTAPVKPAKSSTSSKSDS